MSRAPQSIVFVGSEEAGVSTVINALLGREVIPTSNAPDTFAAVWIQTREIDVPQLRVSQRLRRALRRALKGLRSVPLDPVPVHHRHAVEVDHPVLRSGFTAGEAQCRDALGWLNAVSSALLALGRSAAKHLHSAQGDLQLDVPRAGSRMGRPLRMLELPRTYVRRGAATRRLIEQAVSETDALVAVRNATQLATQADIELGQQFARLAKSAHRSIVLINHADRVPPSELESISRATWVATTEMVRPVTVRCSARTHLEAMRIEAAAKVDPEAARNLLANQHPQLAPLLRQADWDPSVVREMVRGYAQASGWASVRRELGFE